jgi:hypothetical protein
MHEVSPIASVCACGEYFTVNTAGELCLVPGQQGLREVLEFKNPGVFQFKKTDYPWLARVKVRVQGAGGGSAGADANTNELIARPGGAGGGYGERLIDAADLAAVESIVVGTGGAAGTASAPGGVGGSSSFGGFVIAPGGDGGTAAMDSGTVPVTSNGIPGPTAGSGDWASGGGAGGGAIRLNGTWGLSGAGGEAHLGHGGFPRNNSGPGTAPRGYGGGAGGALSTGSAETGQTGGNGIVIVELHG